MLPVLLKVGPFELSAYGVFLSLAIIACSFVVWRNIRNYGYSDDKIFDHLVITVLFGLIGARIFFALTHPEIYRLSILRIFLIWQFPGLALWGAVIGVILAFSLFTATLKIPYLYYFDAYGLSLPLAVMFISIGVFLDGTITGKVTGLPLGFPAVGDIGKHHPVALYSFLLAFIFGGVLFSLRTKFRQKIAVGVVGWLAMSFLGLTILSLALVRSDLLYFNGISVDLVLGTILFIGPWGPLYLKLHTHALIKKTVQKIYGKFHKLKEDLHEIS